MKPEFVMRHAQSKCGRWEVEAEKSGKTARLLEYRTRSDSGELIDPCWVIVGFYRGETAFADAIKASEALSTKGRAA